MSMDKTEFENAIAIAKIIELKIIDEMRVRIENPLLERRGSRKCYLLSMVDL